MGKCGFVRISKIKFSSFLSVCVWARFSPSIFCKLSARTALQNQWNTNNMTRWTRDQSFFLFCRCCSVSTFEFFKFCCCSPRIYSVQEQPSPLNFGNVQCKTCLLYSSAYKFKFNNDPANQRMNGREKKMCVLIWWAQNLKFIREANNLCVCRLRRIVVSLHFQLRDVGCCYCYYSSSTKYIYNAYI